MSDNESINSRERSLYKSLVGTLATICMGLIVYLWIGQNTKIDAVKTDLEKQIIDVRGDIKVLDQRLTDQITSMKELQTRVSDLVFTLDGIYPDTSRRISSERKH